MNDLNPSPKLAARSRSKWFLALFLMAGLPATVTPLRADNPPNYLIQWGSFGSGNGQFHSPIGIAIDRSNNVYVADQVNARIEKFDGNGNFLTQWGSFGNGNGQFNGPVGIAIDSSNNVYVVDNGNNRVEKFDSNRNYLTQWGTFGSGNGQFYGPFGVAVDSSNNVYVTDNGNYRVEKFDSNGNFLTTWGSSGSGNGQFQSPQGIVVDSSNNVYVIDDYNNRVEKFDSNGDYLAQWGSLGSGNGQFYNPIGIAIDRSNNVYVADPGNSRVEKFNGNGTYLTQWGSFGSGNGQFEEPIAIGLDGTGNVVYVADANNNRIEVFANTNIPPVITAQPASQNVPIGGNVTFSVGVLSIGVFGTETLGYQWTSNNVALPGATNSTLTLTNVNVAAAAASYAVLVTNNFGGTLSSNAVLTVVPTVVTTLSASGISDTSAVLNGLAAVGSDETIVWFDWGTDTNYGNIAGTTVVPAGSGSSNISAALSGLLGNVYHYRLDAANDIGIVYGNDQSFTVGFAPTATTLEPMNNTTGTTFNATINPNGWDTTVYFKWGTSSISLTNSTQVMDVGAGAAPLNVSSFITGLIQAKQYDYQVVASNYLGNVTGATVPFLTAPFTSAPLLQWNAVAASADGTRLVAGGTLYISTNAGATWTHPTTPFGQVEGVASSADGTKLAAVLWPGPIYISTNSGAIWTQATNAPIADWNSVAMSADGSKLAAVAENLIGVYTSTNAGIQWTFHTNGVPNYEGIDYIASSADGSKLAATVGGIGNGPIFTSTNFGVNWIQATNAPLMRWFSVASSADGTKLAACAAIAGNVYLSTNSGVIWTKTSLPINYWNSVAVSADGMKIMALANSQNGTIGIGKGGIFTSTNSGASWLSNNVPSWEWNCAAMSADGAELISVVSSSTGGIYISQTTPSPVLNLSASDNVLSWIIPSLDFTLQQSPDLSNWTDVTNAPVLNFTNLEYQVALPSTVESSFFRLKN